MTAIPRSLVTVGLSAVERVPVPDAILRPAIRRLIETRALPSEASSARDAAFAAAMRRAPIARHAAAANAQHYELPPEFFGLVLGRHRKYSCCYYEGPATRLDEAEAAALAATCARAQLADGQRILELGCGWGSLSLWMAAKYPGSRITAVSNAHAQRRYIEAEAERRGLSNLEVVTADMNTFEPAGPFDRAVSVEMFEHMTNWGALLARVRGALQPDGRLFIHIFTHRTAPYLFDHDDPADWIGQHFFTGGLMPSEGLIGAFADVFRIEEQWRWSGTHYARTARHWLENYDRNGSEIFEILQRTYGNDARLWQRRWRLFFLAVEGLFGYGGGSAWGVSHYRLAPVPG